MFHIKLKELREEKEISQTKLAREIGYTQSHIAKWEKKIHEPTASAILAIANYFNVSTDELLGVDYEYQFEYQHKDTKLVHKEKSKK